MTWPDAVSLDPLATTASPAVEAILDGPGSAAPVLVLAVGPLARKEGWAAQTAIALAQRFADRGESVILADLCLQEPELHEVLGSENEEGLTDVFLFGASLHHITRTIPGQRFRLIPASQFTPDVGEVLRHERWGALFEELAENQSKLLVYLPVEAAGAGDLSDRAGHTIVLADRSELEQVRAGLSADADVIGVLVPAAETETETETETDVVAPTPALPQSPLKRRDDRDFEKIRIPKDGAREALIADLRKRQRAELMAPPPSMTPLPTHEATAPPRPRTPPPRPGTPPPPKPPRSRTVPPRPSQPVFTLATAEAPPRRVRGWVAWLLIILVAVAFAAAVWFLWLQSEFFSKGREQAQPTQPALPASEMPQLPPQGSPLPYSVAIASYQVLALAQNQVDQLSEQQPELSFYIGPIAVQGTLFYRVMAGPVADSAAAVELRDALVDIRIKTGSSGWDVLSTPYAFLIAEYESRGSAEAAQQDAVQEGVPSYIVTTRSPAGSFRYRLYAGAFMGPGDAEFMRQILRDAGLPDNLVERTGST